jgi:Mannosyl-glycoprotein endo-beta-N-acetylglucosaminidase/LysM domain
MVKVVKVFVSLWIILFFAGQVFAQQDDYNAIVNKYIRQYKEIAVKEMMVYRVPASITLAQGILESNAGCSDLAVKANNHFGIKCHKEWTGKTFYKDDDAKDECFRKYDSPVESFRDHSWFLTQRDRYKSLFDLDVTDYKGWATGLKKAGYATNPEYAQKLIKTIETFGLYKFDNADFATTFGDTLKTMSAPEKQAWLRKFVVVTKGGGNRDIFENNRLQMIIARPDDNLYTIARDFKTTVSDLLTYNDLKKATDLKAGQIVYLEHKRRKGAAENHKVQPGESLYSISQLYGIKLKLLYKRNDLREGVEPKKGTILRLR